MTHDVIDVIVVDAELPGFPTLNGALISAVFDDDTDRWTLTTADGQTCRSRVVITATPPLVPWIPNLFGRREFRGPSFHAAAPAADFDPAARRIAVIGGDASAGQLIDGLATSGAVIKVFPLPPRRVVRPIRRRRRRHRAKVIASPVNELTAAGIRTADGVHHDADAIVYGTGFAIRPGLPQDALVGTGGRNIQQAWTDGSEPYLGIALHGFPNYFICNGPVLECLQLLNGHTRIEIRRNSQQVYNERVHLKQPRPHLSAFDVSSKDLYGDAYEGPATLNAVGTCAHVRVRLTGHIDPIDGQYHWQGTIFGQLPTDLNRTVTLAVGERSASARITEKTAQGTYSISGVGAPPFALSD